MGIQVEFNPDLALRNSSYFEKGERKKEECVPEPIEEGKVYEFLKKGLRNYWLDGELPLVETTGNQNLSKPLASIVFVEVTHFRENNENWTRGKYKVIEVFKDNKIHFNAMEKINPRV